MEQEQSGNNKIAAAFFSRQKCLELEDLQVNKHFVFIYYLKFIFGARIVAN